MGALVELGPLLIPILAISVGLVAVFGRVIVKPMLDHKMQQMELQAKMAAEADARQNARSERLEQRVAVLERILTDRSANLAEEIERLRDSPLN